MQIVNSITVAGAVTALPDVESDAPVSRLTCKKRNLQAPEREVRELTRMATGMSRIACKVKV